MRFSFLHTSTPNSTHGEDHPTRRIGDDDPPIALRIILNLIELEAKRPILLINASEELKTSLHSSVKQDLGANVPFVLKRGPEVVRKEGVSQLFREAINLQFVEKDNIYEGVVSMISATDPLDKSAPVDIILTSKEESQWLRVNPSWAPRTHRYLVGTEEKRINVGERIRITRKADRSEVLELTRRDPFKTKEELDSERGQDQIPVGGVYKTESHTHHRTLAELCASNTQLDQSTCGDKFATLDSDILKTLVKPSPTEVVCGVVLVEDAQEMDVDCLAALVRLAQSPMSPSVVLSVTCVDLSEATDLSCLDLFDAIPTDIVDASTVLERIPKPKDSEKAGLLAVLQMRVQKASALIVQRVVGETKPMKLDDFLEKKHSWKDKGRV
ncbi:hypothetical protein D9611_011503 [Ephemerocybe angulata]|uniref:RuvB-like helicase n=1 Tax=Ephemerocybe angulata TaxID=980116 RepID=A0A8H5FJX7_9AGAR|nr:hypothetical protein D9611_011503 [Tulosesus angulatus]